MTELSGMILDGFTADVWSVELTDRGIELSFKGPNGQAFDRRILLDTDGTSALDKTIGELYRRNI